MRTLNCNVKGKLENKKYQELVTLCNQCLERISDLAPSDNDVKLVIDEEKDHYLASLHVASIGLTLDLQNEAKSPFMAVEGITKEALQNIQKWSVLRG